MKYNIEGFDQAEMVRLGMDAVDAILLRWVVDFWPMTTKRRFGDDEYGWIAFAHVAFDLPLLGIQNTEVIGRQFKKMVKSGLLISHVERSENSRTYFRFGPAYPALVRRGPVTETSEAGDLNVGGRRPNGLQAGDRTVSEPATERSNNPSTNDPSTSDPKKGASPLAADQVRGVTDLFWRLYAGRCGGRKPSWRPDFYTRTRALLDAHGGSTVLAAVGGYFEHDWWFTKDRTSGRKTWSYGGFLQHFDEVQAGISEARSAAESEYLARNAEAAAVVMGGGTV